MSRSVPILKLSAYAAGAQARTAFCDALFEGLRDFGFVILRDHGVSADLLARAYRLSAALFALPEPEKRAYAAGLRGYIPFGAEHAKDHPAPDLKEMWQIGREAPAPTPAGGASAGEDDTFPPNVWPAHPTGFRETFAALYEALDATGRTALEALTPGLGLPACFFDPLVKDGNSILRLLHYPPISPDADPRSVRAAPHEDINFITLLVAAQGSGLQLLDRDGAWLSVDAEAGDLILDSGDMLARMTNGLIPATTHRVVNPMGPNVSRYSMPFFMHPRNDVSLAPLPSCVGEAGAKFAPITAGDFLRQRLREIGLTASKG